MTAVAAGFLPPIWVSWTVEPDFAETVRGVILKPTPASGRSSSLRCVLLNTIDLASLNSLGRGLSPSFPARTEHNDDDCDDAMPAGQDNASL